MDVTEEDIKIAGINAEYKAINDYYTKKREQSDHRLKGYAKFDRWFLLFVIYFAAFIHGINIAISLETVAPPPSMPMWVFHDAGILISLFSAGILVYVLGKVYAIDSLEIDLARVPVAFAGVFLVILVLTLLAFFQDDFTLFAQLILWILLVFTAYGIAINDKRTVELDKIKKEAKEKAEQELKTAASEGRVKEIHRCSVCQQESIYDLCLTCEETYRAERHRIRNQILRAKKANVEATLTLVQWLTTLSNFHWKCAYCQTGPYQVMEHYVPVSQGGGTTAENCVPACFKCNSEKASKHPEEEQDEWEYMAKATSKQRPVVKRTSRK